jgi:hypothetical protein
MCYSDLKSVQISEAVGVMELKEEESSETQGKGNSEAATEQLQ